MKITIYKPKLWKGKRNLKFGSDSVNYKFAINNNEAS